MSLSDSMAYDSTGHITIKFDKNGLERLLDSLNDNRRGEAFEYLQTEPGKAEIVCYKLSWAQRLYALAASQESRN